MTFTQPLWLFAAVLFAIVFVWSRSAGNNDWSRVMKPAVFNYLGGSSRRKKRLLAFLVATLAAIALANPSTPTDNADSFRSASGWIILADVSRSMTIDDIAPSRLSAMRSIAAELAKASAASPVALIVYAGDAFLVAPPAIDKSFYTDTIALLEHGLLDLEGSNLTRALSLTTSVINSANWFNARVVVLTDTGGINTRAETAVARLSSAGHTTDVIVFGTGQASANAEFDIEAAAALASAGSGQLYQVDTLGRLDFADFKITSIDRTGASLIQSGITLLHTQNQSHWLLLFCLPVLLLMFARLRT